MLHAHTSRRSCVIDYFLFLLVITCNLLLCKVAFCFLQTSNANLWSSFQGEWIGVVLPIPLFGQRTILYDRAFGQNILAAQLAFPLYLLSTLSSRCFICYMLSWWSSHTVYGILFDWIWKAEVLGVNCEETSFINKISCGS